MATRKQQSPLFGSSKFYCITLTSTDITTITIPISIIDTATTIN